MGTAAGNYENETWGHNEGLWVGWEYLLTDRVGLGPVGVVHPIV